LVHSLGDRSRPLRTGVRDIFLRPDSWHVNPQVDPVAERAGHAPGIPVDDRRLAAASAVTLAGMSARASVKR
jgi:hypothetical protein